mmetsp:Transcript_16618/g.52933  ORF Transcript_16618/g.52933 Transcript_16618/m.52933 type:complete len:228 (-) Transcript_16618:385-1068(-)
MRHSPSKTHTSQLVGVLPCSHAQQREFGRRANLQFGWLGHRADQCLLVESSQELAVETKGLSVGETAASARDRSLVQHYAPLLDTDLRRPMEVDGMVERHAHGPRNVVAVRTSRSADHASVAHEGEHGAVGLPIAALDETARRKPHVGQLPVLAFYNGVATDVERDVLGGPVGKVFWRRERLLDSQLAESVLERHFKLHAELGLVEACLGKADCVVVLLSLHCPCHE